MRLIFMCSLIVCFNALDVDAEIQRDDLIATLKGYENAVTMDRSGLDALKKQAAYQSALQAWDLIRRLDEATLAAWNADASRLELLQQLLNDPDAMAALLESGPVPDDMSGVLDLLYDITRLHPDAMDNPISRDTAIACAHEGIRRKMDRDLAIARGDYFIRNWKDRRLHAVFDDIQPWERRFIAYGPQWGGYSEISSMEYLLENVHIPVEAYSGACWRAPYRGRNAFGDSVHGRWYYQPIADHYDSFAEMVDIHGGVCGALSNFGAAAAIANGVPALTVGEPGHCAYAVRVRPNQWQPAYSLTWQRYPHTHFFGGKWEHLIATDDCFSKPDMVAEALQWRRMSERFAALDNTEMSGAAMWQAVETHPPHLNLWVKLASKLNEQNADAKLWQRYHDLIIEKTLPAYPDSTFYILQHHVYPKLLAEANTPQEKAAVLMPFQEALSDAAKAGRWDYEHTLRMADRWIADEAAFEQMLSELIEVQLNREAYSGLCIGWIAGRYKDKPEKLQALAASIAQSADQESPDASKNAIMAMARMVLPEAAKRGDRQTFWTVGQLTEPYVGGTVKGVEAPQPKGFPLSDGGLLMVSSPGNRYDNPATHWGVLSPNGGAFHTAGEKNSIAEIGLGHFGQPQEILIVTRPGAYQGRMVPFRIMVSKDRENWEEVYRYEGGPKRMYHIKLPEDTPTAHWVRYEKIGNGPIHLALFRVFGEKRS